MGNNSKIDNGEIVNHKFLPSQLDKLHCCYQFQEFSIKCNRDLMAHTKLATCESCNAIAECEIYQDNILMCWNCKDKNIQVLIDKTEASAIEQRATNKLAAEVERIGMDGLKFSGDFYNLQLQTFSEMSTQLKMMKVYQLTKRNMYSRKWYLIEL